MILFEQRTSRLEVEGLSQEVYIRLLTVAEYHQAMSMAEGGDDHNPRFADKLLSCALVDENGEQFVKPGRGKPSDASISDMLPGYALPEILEQVMQHNGIPIDSETETPEGEAEPGEA